MRVLHLNHTGSFDGGVEGYISDVSSALAAAGHQSMLVYFSPSNPSTTLAGAVYAPLPEWPAPPEAAIGVLDETMQQFRPDVVLVHAVYHPALVEWTARRVPTLAYVHGPYLVCPGSGQYLRRRSVVCTHRAGLVCMINAQLENCCWGGNPLFHRQLLRRVSAFLTVYRELQSLLVGSEFMRQLLERSGIPPERLSILPPVLVQEPLPEMTFEADNRTVLFAGRLVPEKGLQQLIRALASINGGWELVVAGDGPERERCEGIALRLGVRDRVHFRGWLDSAGMTAVLQESACVAVPSLWPEPFGRLGPEAFTYGRPVVAFAVGGIPDWLEDGRTGFLVPAGDVAGLARAVQSLLESPEARLQMGNAARRRSRDGWNAAEHVQCLLSKLERVGRQCGPMYSEEATVTQL